MSCPGGLSILSSLSIPKWLILNDSVPLPSLASPWWFLHLPPGIIFENSFWEVLRYLTQITTTSPAVSKKKGGGSVNTPTALSNHTNYLRGSHKMWQGQSGNCNVHSLIRSGYKYCLLNQSKQRTFKYVLEISLALCISKSSGLFVPID